MPVKFVFAFAGIKTGWDKRKEQKMPVSFCVCIYWKTGWDKKETKNAC